MKNSVVLIVLFISCPTGTVQESEMAFCLYTSAKLCRYTLTSNNKNKVNGIFFCTCHSILWVSISLYNTRITLWNMMSCNRTHPTARHVVPIAFHCYKLVVFIYLLPSILLFLYQVILLISGELAFRSWTSSYDSTSVFDKFICPTPSKYFLGNSLM